MQSGFGLKKIGLKLVLEIYHTRANQIQFPLFLKIWCNFTTLIQSTICIGQFQIIRTRFCSREKPGRNPKNLDTSVSSKSTLEPSSTSFKARNTFPDISGSFSIHLQASKHQQSSHYSITVCLPNSNSISMFYVW